MDNIYIKEVSSLKGIILFADYFEDVEGLGTLALLRRAKLSVTSVSVMSTLHITTQYGMSIETDQMLNNIDPNEYDFLVIPGGKAVGATLRNDERVLNLISSFVQKQKLVAAICAAPSLLGQLSLLDRKNFTCFPGFEQYMLNGAYRPEKKAVTDGKIVTARSAGAIYEFVYEILQVLKGKEEADHLLQNIVF